MFGIRNNVNALVEIKVSLEPDALVELTTQDTFDPTFKFRKGILSRTFSKDCLLPSITSI